jgi:hypothetical protein
MVADSIRRLDEPAGCVPPKTPKTTLLPPSVLPPSVQERSADKAVQTGTKAWLAVAAACCIAFASMVPLPSVAEAETAVAEQRQESAPGVAMTQAQVEAVLRTVPLTAIVNAEGSPYMIDSERGTNLGFFYLEPNDALRDLQVLKQSGNGEAALKVLPLSDVFFPYITSSDTPKDDVQAKQSGLGGLLRLRPSRKQVVLANRAISANGNGGGGFLPTTLEERNGQVPVFYSERVVLQEVDGVAFPFFFSKDDLDAAWQGGSEPGGENAAGGFSEQPFGGASPGQKRRKNAEGKNGIPIGLVRVATLEGLVKQMRSGDVDLRRAVLVGSREAEAAIQSLAGKPFATE